MILLYKSSLKVAARKLRTNMTETEKQLWGAIRNKKLYGVQFYRQKIIGPYVVDFYAPAGNLVIEIDGSQHSSSLNACYGGGFVWAYTLSPLLLK